MTTGQAIPFKCQHCSQLAVMRERFQNPYRYTMLERDFTRALINTFPRIGFVFRIDEPAHRSFVLTQPSQNILLRKDSKMYSCFLSFLMFVKPSLFQDCVVVYIELNTPILHHFVLYSENVLLQLHIREGEVIMYTCVVPHASTLGGCSNEWCLLEGRGTNWHTLLLSPSRG